MLGLFFAFLTLLATNAITKHKDKLCTALEDHPEMWTLTGVSCRKGETEKDFLLPWQTLWCSVGSKQSKGPWKSQFLAVLASDKGRNPLGQVQSCAEEAPNLENLMLCKCQCPNTRHSLTLSTADYRVKGMSRQQHVRASVVHSQCHRGPEAQFTLTGPQTCRCDKGSLLMALPLVRGAADTRRI